MPERVKIYFDGGCRPAPAGMETAVVVGGQSYFRRDLGPGNAMDAEWRALIHAVEIARELGITDPLFLGDALAVIQQANGTVKCRGVNADHLQRLIAVQGSCAPLAIRHVKRTQNLAGIALTRLHR